VGYMPLAAAPRSTKRSRFTLPPSDDRCSASCAHRQESNGGRWRRVETALHPLALASPTRPVTHRTAGPSARVTGARDGRGAAPSFEPSRATLGRVHRPAERRSGDSDGPPDQRPRSWPPPRRQWRAGGGRRRPRSPSWGGAWRHVQRLPRPTSPSRPPPRPRRWPRRPRRSPCGSFGSRAPSLSRPRCSPRRSPRPSGRRRRQGVTSAPPEHLPGGQRLRSGAGGPCGSEGRHHQAGRHRE